MRYLLLTMVLAFALPPVATRAQAPPYQRMRGGADGWQARGGHAQIWRGDGYGGFYHPYFAAPPIVAGSYYQRPYPYHFDYYRYRWGASAPGSDANAGSATPDCPCAVPPPVDVVE